MKCHMQECFKKNTLVIGDCKFCNNSFCCNHRLPEVHDCTNLDDVKIDSLNKYKKEMEDNNLLQVKVKVKM